MVLVATQVKRRRGTTAENDAFTGAEGEITVDTEKHELRVHDGVTQGGFKIGGGSGSGRNTGDTFITKRTDTNLAGAVECDGATYNTTDFTGDDSIGELLEAGKLDYVSLSAYSDAIAQTGWCDKIGWDGAGNTAFRVPTINPRHYIIKSQEPTAENNYTWYRLYADGWVEQGGVQAGNSVYGKATVNLPITMADNTYQAIGNIGWVNESTWYTSSGASGGMRAITDVSGATTDKTTTSFSIESFSNHNWRVCGMSSITPQTNTRVMIQLANGATDQALEICTGVLALLANADFVVERQDPTAENNYTWYRKYKSGWVEQGGITSNFTNTATNTGDYKTVTLLVQMSNTNYDVQATLFSDVSLGNGSTSGWANRVLKPQINSTTQIEIQEWANSASSGTACCAKWTVCGMSAQ